MEPQQNTIQEHEVLNEQKEEPKQEVEQPKEPTAEELEAERKAKLLAELELAYAGA